MDLRGLRLEKEERSRIEDQTFRTRSSMLESRWLHTEEDALTALAAGWARANGRRAACYSDHGTDASIAWLQWQERGATVWNDLQKQMKGKGFTQEELKNMYSQLRKNENHL